MHLITRDLQPNLLKLGAKESGKVLQKAGTQEAWDLAPLVFQSPG
jgi:hypothetical protein